MENNKQSIYKNCKFLSDWKSAAKLIVVGQLIIWTGLLLYLMKYKHTIYKPVWFFGRLPFQNKLLGSPDIVISISILKIYVTFLY